MPVAAQGTFPALSKFVPEGDPCRDYSKTDITLTVSIFENKQNSTPATYLAASTHFIPPAKPGCPARPVTPHSPARHYTITSALRGNSFCTSTSARLTGRWRYEELSSLLAGAWPCSASRCVSMSSSWCCRRTLSLVCRSVHSSAHIARKRIASEARIRGAGSSPTHCKHEIKIRRTAFLQPRNAKKPRTVTYRVGQEEGW
jgi:hypothetical protein